MDESERAPGARPSRPWWRRPRWIVSMGALLLLLIGGAAFAIAWSNRGAEQASLEEAVKSLDSDANRGAAALAPATGVYVYEGTGTESLSVLDTSQEWGPLLPATVEHVADDCWTFTVEYSTHHEQSTTYCPRAGVLEEAGGSTSQTFDLVVTSVEDVTTFVCDPPGEVLRVAATPGSTWRQSCVGRSAQQGTRVTSAGRNTFVGIVSVKTAGGQVRAYHYRARRTLTGDQTGEEEVHTWYRVRDALPVRVERTTRVDSPSPVGTVTYTERGTFTLTEVTPRR